MQFRVTQNLQLPGGRRVTNGETIDGDSLPTGTLQSMLRLHQLVPADTSKPDPPVPTGKSAAPQPQAPPPAAAASYLEIPVAKLKVSPQVKAALSGAGLETVGDVVKYGASSPLTTIPQISDMREAAIQEEIERLAGK